VRINDILKSRIVASAYRISLYNQASGLNIRFPKTRQAILRQLEKMNMSTCDTIDNFILKPRENIFSQELSGLSDIEVFMLAQRWECGLDVLSRLRDAETENIYLELQCCDARQVQDQEEIFMLIGLWNEFGGYWIANLAWRISKGFKSIVEPTVSEESPFFGVYCAHAAVTKIASNHPDKR
jgi:hypothetical protein